MSLRIDRTAGLVLAGAVVVILLAVAVGAGVTDPFDQPIIEAVRADALHDLLSPLRVVTELGSTTAVSAVAVLVLLGGLAMGHARAGLLAALTILLASIGNSLLKVSIARARPDLLEPLVVEHGFSFPSGHSALGMVAYGVVAILVARSTLPPIARRALVGALAVLVLLIGLSRIWLGVHYPTDVLAGWTVGAIVVALYASITRSASTEPVVAAVDEGRGAPRSDRPVTG